mgnify:CR=1 FL=1
MNKNFFKMLINFRHAKKKTDVCQCYDLNPILVPMVIIRRKEIRLMM